MASKEKTVNVALTFNESGILCNTLMQAINMSGGFDKVPAYILVLYEKLLKLTTRLENHVHEISATVDST